MFIKFEKIWFSLIYSEFEKPYFVNLLKLIIQEKKKKKKIYPKYYNIFKFFKITKYKKLKTILIGQDPYCQKNQATGLAFAIPAKEILPGSLKNILKELNDDLGIKIRSKNYNLNIWAKRGALLMNIILTVEENKPLAHKNIGWELFTDHIIKYISLKKKKIIYILLGKQAIQKVPFINNKNTHIIFTTSHPSPKSANKGFLGSRIFSKININLKLLGKKKINWNIS